MSRGSRNYFSKVTFNGNDVTVRCPQCLKTYRRVYKPHENGFGFCKDHSTVAVVRCSALLEEEKLAKRKAQIDAELRGELRTRSSRGHLIA